MNVALVNAWCGLGKTTRKHKNTREKNVKNNSSTHRHIITAHVIKLPTLNEHNTSSVGLYYPNCIWAISRHLKCCFPCDNGSPALVLDFQHPTLGWAPGRLLGMGFVMHGILPALASMSCDKCINLSVIRRLRWGYSSLTPSCNNNSNCHRALEFHA